MIHLEKNEDDIFFYDNKTAALAHIVHFMITKRLLRMFLLLLLNLINEFELSLILRYTVDVHLKDRHKLRTYLRVCHLLYQCIIK